jgi:hypothetical protein
MILALFFLALVTSADVLAQKSSPKPFVIHASHHDISLPLRDLAASEPELLPGVGHILPLRPTRPLPVTGAAPAEDRALQTVTLPLVSTTNELNFDGISADGVAPPDTNGTVGDSVTNQYVQIVNTEYEVYNKTTGAVILGPAAIHTIWSGFTGACSTGDGGDVNAIFDKAAARWVIGQLGPGFTSYCIAVSTSDDATGSYARYEFDFGSNIPDYPKVGVWPDAYYWTSNTFQGGVSFIGAMPCAYDRASMLAGGPANAICFQQNSSVASLLPADLDGSTPPPSGEPNPYIELLDTSDLGLFKFHVDFTNPSNSTFTGPTAIPVTSYSLACGGGTCIPQAPGDGTQLDSLGDRLMFRNAYRNISGTEYLVVNHSVTAGSSVGVRWYQITNPNGTPTVAQQGTFAPDSTYRWMGSVAMDQSGDIAVGYSASSSTIHPAVRYSGRVPSDPAGTLESEDSIIEGTGSQTGGLTRWGDYSGISIDPGDDCTFFYTTEYIPTDGSFNWNTRIASFKFTSCGVTTPDFSLSATPPSQSATAGSTVTYTATATPLNGFSGTVGLTLSGCPANATCTLNPSSVALPPAQNSTLTVQTTSTTPGGTYILTITGTSGSLIHATSVTLIIPDFSISATPSSQNIAAGGSASYTATLAAVNGFSGTVGLTVSGCPSNATCTFNPTSVTVPPNKTSTLTVKTTSTTPGGTYTLMITGTSGSTVHSVPVTLVVKAADFYITAGTSFLRVKPGAKAGYGLSITPLLGFKGSVSLKVTGLPSNSTGAFSPNPVTVTYPKSSKSTLTVTTTTSTPAGTYTLTITGTSGSLTHSVTVTLVVT